MVTSKELDDLGLLRATKLSDDLDWLTDEEKLLMLRLLFCGESGMHARDIAKVRKTQSGSDSLIRLEAYGMAAWERDHSGRQTSLYLTWKGIETADTIKRIAQHENHRSSHGGA